MTTSKRVTEKYLATNRVSAKAPKKSDPAKIRPVGPLKRVDPRRYAPLVLFARDLYKDAEKLEEATAKGLEEDPDLLERLKESIEGCGESLGWVVTVKE